MSNDPIDETRAFLAAIVDSSNDAIVGKDLDGIIRSWNPAAERMFGYTAVEAVGQSIGIIIPRDRWHEEQTILARLRSGERTEHFETVRRAKGGAERLISLTISPIRDAHGTIVGASKIARDITRQRQAELELERNRTMLEAIIEASPLAIAVVSAEGVVELWNAGAERLFGWTSSEVVGKLAPTVPEDRFEELELNLLRTLAGDPLRGVEAVRRRKDGSTVEVVLWSALLRDRAGAPDRLVWIVADATDAKRAERLARESAERLQVALTASRTGTFHWDIGAGALELDANLEALVGVDAERTPKELGDFLALVHPEDLPAVEAGLERARRGEPFSADFRVLQRDGGVVWLFAQGRTILDHEGRPSSMTGACVDITERKRSEESLRESEERFRTLADNISQFAWMADETGSIFWYNERWFDFTGTTREEMAGAGWKKLHHPDHLERVVERYGAAVRAGEIWEDTFPLRAKDGSYRWFLSRAEPIRDEEGRVVRWLGTNTDITERMRMEEALRDANLRKDQFLATLAHELRNPLAPIRTGLELLRMMGGHPADVQRVIDTLDRQSTQLARLVDDLLDVSRITRDKVELRLAEVELADVALSAVETSRPLLDRGGHTLAVDVPAGLRLRADAARLAQVLSNLLNNASKYTTEPGSIALRARRERGEVAIEVSDTGSGLAPEALERVFEPFYQVAASGAVSAGLGIGLTLVSSLVSMHGGSVRAFSEGLGKGSRFVVRLPTTSTDAAATADPESRSEARPDARLRVLVVDDDRDAADAVHALLDRMGHEVRVVYEGRSALDAANELRPDVVLLDLGMPGLDGFDVATRLRAETWGRAMTLAALTGWSQAHDRERTRAAGFDHHLVKPARLEQLERVLARSSARAYAAPRAS